MDNDFEKRLKEQLENISPEDSEEELEQVFAPLVNTMKTLGSASILELGKAAREKINRTIDSFTEETAGFSKSNPTEYYAKMTAKIQRTAETLRILHAIVTTSVIFGGAKITNSEEDADKLLNTIIHLCRN